MQQGLPNVFTETPDTGKRPVQKVVIPGQTPSGEPVLSVIVKRTYDIIPDNRCTRAAEDQKIFSGDVHYDGPVNSSVQHESDLVPWKIATDVVLNGSAYAPKGKTAQVLKASLGIGGVRKDVLVLGNRKCRYRRLGNPVFTDPEPFKSMPIRYELAYGGIDIYSDFRVRYFYPRNPLGRGFVVSKTKQSVENLLLPNIEDAAHLVTPEKICLKDYQNWEQQPLPQGFGWTTKFWQPRASLGGVMPADKRIEQELREAYALAVPVEYRELYQKHTLPHMDFKFFNGASQGLVLPFLKGDEQVRLVNLSPDGEVGFELPGDRPAIGVDIGAGIQESQVVLHTVMIRTDDRQVDLVWRGAVSYPGTEWLPEMKKMDMVVE